MFFLFKFIIFYFTIFRNWQNLLLSKSLEFIDRALPKQNDQNLMLAREVLTLIPGKEKPTKEIEKQKETISMIETCIQMGSQRLPATYRFCSPEIILQEVISSNKNYKQVKKCAEISKLLGLKPAVAKAMAYCAVEAAKSDDVSTLQKYIQKLNSTSRDMPIIYFVCKDIITSGKWQHVSFWRFSGDERSYNRVHCATLHLNVLIL